MLLFIRILRLFDVFIFRWCNTKLRTARFGGWLRPLTHLGGAAFTVTATLAIAALAPAPWNAAGWQSFAALSASFLITTLLKRKLRRVRPYLAIPDVHVGGKALKDPSFPSGHTTAIFSIVTPFMLALPWLSLPLVVLASAVSLSRVVLGLHYPSDCLAGCFVGLTTAAFVVWL